jgi:hypothetical protein
MIPEDRLAEAQKQLRLAAAHDHVSEIQANAIGGVVTVVEELERSIQRTRQDKLVSDGGAPTIDTSELSDDEIEAVLQTPAFQKSLKYRRLAQGIEVLEEDDAIYRQLVATITEQHGQVSTRASIEEVLDLFVEEVKTYTEGMDVTNADGDDDPLQAVITEEGDDE